jgi:two-component system, response regulator YesN
MIKVLLVDDEPIITKGLRKLISWESLDCEIVGEACDGEEAYEFILKNRPDLVITDLLMPFMDGIELVKKLHEEKINTEIIILSGHGEFEYAREALKFGVFEYLLKPVTREQLIDTVQKALKKINSNLMHTEKIERIKAQLRESMPIFKDKFIFDIIRGEIQDGDSIRKKAELFEIKYSGVGYMVFAIDIENIYDNKMVESEKDELLLKFAVENIADEIVKKYASGFVVVSGDLLYVLTIAEEMSLTSSEIFKIAEEIKECLYEFLRVYVSIGIGRQYPDILLVKKSFEEANKALKSKFIIGKGSIIHINNIVSREEEKGLYPENEEKKVLDSLLYTLDLSSQNMAEHLIQSFVNSSNGDTRLIYSFCLEFLIQLGRCMRTLSGDSDKTLDLETGETQIKSCKTIHELRDWLTSTLEKCITRISAMRKAKEYDAIHEAKNYIDANYAEDLTLNKVASKVYMSPTYFSAQFKNKTGENFCDYLSKLRMQNAAKLLMDNQTKTYEISEAVGYKNPRYFSDAFKRYYGLTPSEYREKNFNSKT